MRTCHSSIRAREITAGGDVFRDDRVRVTAARNHHPPIEHSFAYRFDSVDRSIVISGDTTYSESVLHLARGADVLVHEALYPPFWERPDAPRTPAIRRHILASHTAVEDVGRDGWCGQVIPIEWIRHGVTLTSYVPVGAGLAPATFSQMTLIEGGDKARRYQA